MSAAVSSSSKPSKGVVTATTSLDGVLSDCSEDASSLPELMSHDFDKLILTLEPKLVGMDESHIKLSSSIPLSLVSQEKVEAGLQLTYERLS